MSAALFGRGVPTWGGPEEVEKIGWPVPFPYRTDMEKAKAPVAAATSGAGISTSLTFDAGSATIAEPFTVLVQESLGQIGIKVELNKVPGANFRGELNKKTAPMVLTALAAGWTGPITSSSGTTTARIPSSMWRLTRTRKWTR